MNESGVWQYLRKSMICSGWHVTRVESSAGNGYPDVSFGIPGINGFIELKYIPEWPKRVTTLIKLPLRPEQKHWVKCRGELAGNVWVFIRIAESFFLLSWEQAIDAYGGWTREEWEKFPDGYWEKRVDFNELCGLLKGGC